MRIEYKENLTRTVVVDVPITGELDNEQLELVSREPIMEQVNEDGWGVEEVHETFYRICDE